MINNPPKHHHQQWVGIAILSVLLSTCAPPIAYADTATHWKGKPTDWHETEATYSILSKAERNAGLPRGLAHCVAYAESRFKESALSPDKQDRGLMQINRRYEQYIVERYGKINHTNFRWDNAEQNATAGCEYLSAMIDRFGGSVYLGLIAYNWGPGNLASIREWNDIPKSKRRYAERILAMLDEWNEWR
jgi:soluble lytic murein transglycosylase-like protein